MTKQATNNVIKIDDPSNFQIPVANAQLEKPLATTTFKVDIGDDNFAEHFVVMKILTGSIIELHLLRHNSVVVDTTHGLIYFSHLTVQFKNAASEPNAKPQSVFTD